MPLQSNGYLPPELARIGHLKGVWYALACILVIVSAIWLAGILPVPDSRAWLTWISNTIQAVQTTLSLFLVVLTYNLFNVASRVTEQNERIHRISQLPIVVADVKPFSLRPYPSYQIRVVNEGSGPALDIDVGFEYRRNNGTSAGAGAHFSIAVMNKESQTGLIVVDARDMVDSDAHPSFTRVQSEMELAPYVLVVTIRYKDIYNQEGRTTYEASSPVGDLGVELVELAAPAITVGSEVNPIAFSRRPLPRHLVVDAGSITRS